MKLILEKSRNAESDSTERLTQAVTAACSIAINSGILASLIYLLAALASMLTAGPTFG